MDQTISRISEYVLSQRSVDLDSSIIEEGVKHHLDGVACAAGGFSSAPCRIAREVAGIAALPNGCTVYGLAEGSTPEYAAFANGAANRYLDYNDVGIQPARNGGHPNDMTPAIFAAVEMVGGSGLDLIRGTCIGYEVFAILGTVDWRSNGWDQGALISVATAAATSSVFQLDMKGVGNAIALAITGGLPLRVTRTGEISDWKGCATAHAAMNGLFAARLAKAGLTGPPEAFEGIEGVQAQRTKGGAHEPFKLDRLGAAIGGKAAIQRSWFKFYPTEWNSQGPVESILKLRENFDLDDVKEINIYTYWLAWHEIGGGQGDRAEKWDPKTRETADHSLPYVAAVALVDGAITLQSFSDARVSDPALRPVMNKVRVIQDAAFDERHKVKREWPALVEIVLHDGRTFSDDVSYPRGDLKNPMDEVDFSTKFDAMIEYVLPKDEGRHCRELLWSLDQLDDLRPLANIFRRWTDRL